MNHPCPECDARCTSNLAMAAHLLEQHQAQFLYEYLFAEIPPNAPAEEEDIGNPHSPGFKCWCNSWYRTPTVLAMHLRRHGGAQTHYLACHLNLPLED